MIKYYLILACLLAPQLAAGPWRPPDRLLHAVRYVESNHGLFTWGDNGRSLGEYQLSEAAWMDVTLWRKSRGLATFSYRHDVWDPTISRSYAADYLSLLHRELKRRLNRPPNVLELYAAYNLGLSGFAQCEYQLGRVNPTTARKCRQIRALMAAK
ncbi:MAG: hypothetical protein U1G07_13695 [Verrucomicrobiota bacterium]